MMPATRLSPKHQAFVREYVKDWNGTQAVIRAEYSEKGASVTATRLLANPKIQEAIQRSHAKIAERAEITVVDVLKMLEREASAGDLDQPNSARIKAQELIGKHIGMFSDKQTGQNTGGAPQIIMQFNTKVESNTIVEAEDGE